MFKKRDFATTLNLLCNSKPELLKKDGSLNVACAARKIGLNQPTMKRMLDGLHAQPGKDNAKKLSDFFGVTINQLYGFEPIQTLDIEAERNSTARVHQHEVPLISWVQAGRWGQLNHDSIPSSHIICPKRHSESTYALVVSGDSMTSPAGRSYCEGSIIYVDPEQRNSVVSGDRVIAKNTLNEITFKQLANDGSRRYLKALNPNHPPMFENFTVLGKVIGMFMDE